MTRYIIKHPPWWVFLTLPVGLPLVAGIAVVVGIIWCGWWYLIHGTNPVTEAINAFEDR